MRTSWADKVGPEVLTFDDVLLVPRHAAVHPREVDLSTPFSRNIRLNVPLVSAAMDTVTESALAIAIAREGGIGVIHKNLSIEEQVQQVDRVKRSESGMIVDPVTLPPSATLGEAHAIMARFHISGVPITEHGRLVGILTNRDLRFEDDHTRRVSEVMTRERLITAPVGTTLEQARDILAKYRIEKLPVVDAAGELKGLITVKDIEKRIRHPLACKDTLGRLRVAAAIGAAGDYLERAQELARAGVDALVIDSAHAHSRGVLEAAGAVRAALSGPDLVIGNVGTGDGAKAVADAGADAVKVGMGPGAICTTRVVTGAGMAQVTAILDAARALESRDVPLIADGGIKYSGDLVKAIAAGAHSVMMGGAVRRYGGEPRRGGAARGPPVQGVPRDGFAFRDGGRARQPRALFPGEHRRVVETRARGDRGPRSIQGAARGDRVSNGGRAAGRHGILWLRLDRVHASRRAFRAPERRGPARESSARRDDHQGRTELRQLTPGSTPPIPIR